MSNQIKTEEVRTELHGVKTAAEAMEMGDLMWAVEQSEIITSNGLEIPDHKALYRSDNKNILGVVGKGYQPIQNSMAFSFFDTICEKYDAEYNYAYCLSGGRKIALQAKINGGFDVRPGDHVDKYATLYNSHDGSGSFTAFITSIRLWCMNQSRVALQNSTHTIRIRHTGTAEERAKDAFRIFNLGIEAFADFEEKSKYLANKVVDKAMVDSFLDEVIGSPLRGVNAETGAEVISARTQNRREDIVQRFESTEMGNGQGTAWDLYNGLTEHVDHGVHKTNADKRYVSAMFGNGSELKVKAFNTALDL